MSNIGQMWPDVLGAYLFDYSSRLTASDISKRMRLPRRTISRILLQLVKLNLIEYEIRGRNKMFYLDLDNPKSKILLDIAESKKALNFSLREKEIYLIIMDLLEICSSVVVFGSYASGKNKRDSDLDLVVFGCKDKKKLNKLRERHLVEINEHLVNYSEFEKLIKKRNPLSLEILNNHVIFGETSRIVEMFRRFYG